ncbi:MAG TPA: C4-type zinc ribbon domain-containing protein [Bacteroidales bacterium]|jgi:predicted  nucleic acid-binding Zn-ribbon protein|nr:C4-type zinc ribbon domain-containing protein [Bacteroidales bacterium]MDY0086121.1 C4-type zinc ribbon domain-containing protein [Bacteroidales bacterium]HPE43567.1 C4-type zinc ribbon domain-containing protein [Bacteroidales bacterium]
MAVEKQAEKTKATKKAQVEEVAEVSVEQKLVALYTLQQIDSQIDRIRIIRGELPLEVQDLEDEIIGLETRVDNIDNEMKSLSSAITEKKQAIKDSETLIKRYEEQQQNVRNNREYDSLSKESEFQTLEIQLAEKRIREFTEKLTELEELMKIAKEKLSDRSADLEVKKSELNSIIEETEKDEKALIEKSKENEKLIEDRLLVAYKRIRTNARNGLAVVQIERDACGGCFNKIPPQHQLDIRMHKKIIVCEYCGRILVDHEIAEHYSS